jgi:UDP-GlcNAc3NAcA epimerase
MKIVTILAARPQFIKASILSKLFKSKKGLKKLLYTPDNITILQCRIFFFDELKVSKLHYKLGVISLNKQSPEEISGISSDYKIKKIIFYKL